LKRNTGTLFGSRKIKASPAPEQVEVPPQETRWVWRRKAQVVTAVDNGLLSLDEACSRYAMSIEEFRSWQKDYYYAGVRNEGGQRVTNLQTKGRA
jgi:hypothetical protein